MKKIMSVKKHKSSLMKAVHKQKKQTVKAVNKKEHELLGGFGKLRGFIEMLLAVKKRLKRNGNNQ